METKIRYIEINTKIFNFSQNVFNRSKALLKDRIKGAIIALSELYLLQQCYDAFIQFLFRFIRAKRRECTQGGSN